MWRACLTGFIILLMVNSSSGLSAAISPDIKYNGHEYKLFNDSMTWQQAKSYCESLGGHLMTITSQQEQEIAETLLRTRGVKNNYWLGGYRNGNAYIWITGEEFNYSHWALGEPNNAFGREYIVSMYKNRNPVTNCNNSGDWNDISDDGSCNNEPFFGSHNFGFICEWDTNVIIERDSYRAVNDKIITDGIYSLRPQCAPGKELSVENNSTNWGANVIIDNINSNFKKWKIQRIANTDYYSIIAVHSNLALDVANARAENGVNISTWPYLGGSQNQFKILNKGNGYYVIQANIGGNFVVDVLNAENRAGANVWSYGFNGTPAQLWKLVLIEKLPVFQSYSKRATQKVNAYVMSDLQARVGDEYVSAGDNVTVLREEDDAIFVSYPVRGGTKERWVNKNDIFNEVEIKSNVSDGLLYPMKGNIIVTDSSATLKNSGGIKCDYKAIQGEDTEIRAPADGFVEFRQTYSTKYNAMISYANHIIFTTTIGNDNYEIKCCHLSRFVGESNDPCIIQKSLTRSPGRGCGESDLDPDGELYGSHKATITLGYKSIPVTKNQLLGYAGKTGNANGIHVHMEVRKNGKLVNPKSVFHTW